MPYGAIKVDNITFTNGGADQATTVSGIYRAITSGVTVTGTISGATIQGATVSGTTVTGTTANFVSGVFTTQLSGVTVTGTTASFTSGVFTALSGTTTTVTSGIFGAGSAAAPSITFSGDLNTGIYNPAADTLAFVEGGVEALRIDSSGRVGIGTTSPQNQLVVSNGGAAGLELSPTGFIGAPVIVSYNRSGAAYTQLALDGATNVFAISGTERARIDSSGRLLVGASATQVGAGGSDLLQVTGAINVVSSTNIYSRLLSTASGLEIIANAYPANLGSTQFIIFKSGTSGGGGPSEIARFTSDGMLGIGTTSPLTKLDVRSGVITAGSVDAPNGAEILRGYYGAGAITVIGSEYSSGGPVIGYGVKPSTTTTDAFLSSDSGALPRGAYTIGGNIHKWYIGANQTVAENSSVSTSEVMRIDSSGRLLVGTSSAFDATADAVIQAATTNGAFACLGNSDTSVLTNENLGLLRFFSRGGSVWEEGARIEAEADLDHASGDKPTRLVFSTTADGAASPTERMRISQNGNAYIGTTADLVSDTNSLHVSGTRAIVGRATGGATNPVITSWNNATSGDNVFISFRTETADTERGTIDYNRAGGQVRYNVTSDRRLKSEIQPAASALDNLAAIQVRAYKWTETDYQINYGFVAQELNEVAPDAVKEGDYGEEITNIWAVDNSKLVPLLTKALQEAIARIETLEAKVAALESA